MPSKKTAFTTRVDPVSPPKSPAMPEEFGGGAGYRPRVRYAYSVARLSP